MFPHHCRFPLLLPILEAEYATNKIMQAIRSNQNILMMPRLLYLTYFLLGSACVFGDACLYVYTSGCVVYASKLG